jgi:RNA polymerase sigma factor (sigma-70 family)
MELFRPRRPNRGVVKRLTPSLGQHPTDAAAIALSLNEPAAFAAVFERHFSLVHRFLCARAGVEPAADLASETFAVAFRRRADYDRDRPAARPWLIGIAVNLARQARRSERRLNRALARLAGERTLHKDSPEAGLESHGNIMALREVLADLSPNDRDLLLLFACLEFSYEQIAETMSLPIGTVRSRIHRLRHKLRGHLTQAAGEQGGV